MFIGICFYNVTIFSTVKLANLLVRILMEGLDLLQRNPVTSVLPETTWSGRGFQGGIQKSCFQSEPLVQTGLLATQSTAQKARPKLLKSVLMVYEMFRGLYSDVTDF